MGVQTFTQATKEVFGFFFQCHNLGNKLQICTNFFSLQRLHSLYTLKRKSHNLTKTFAHKCNCETIITLETICYQQLLQMLL